MKPKRFRLVPNWAKRFLRFLCRKLYPAWLGKSVDFIRHRVYASMRIQLMLAFLICLVAAISAGAFSAAILEDYDRVGFINYSQGRQNIDHRARVLVDRLQNPDQRFDPDVNGEGNENSSPATPARKPDIQKIIDAYANQFPTLKVLITDYNGTVHYKSEKALESQIDLHSVIRNAMDARLDNNYTAGRNEQEEFYTLYPIQIADVTGYVIVRGIPEGHISYQSSSLTVLSVPIAVAVFILLFLLITRKKMSYVEELADGLLVISEGNLDHRVSVKSKDELGSLANNINHMAEELHTKIEEERRLEKAKNELITNVSHDLRTPLTSIMGYMKLLIDKKYQDEQQMREYMHVVSSKSEKLKLLMEDLFEYTKLTNDGIQLRKESVCLNELLEQLAEEFVPLAEEKQLSITKRITEEKIFAEVDPDKLARVLDNLLTNAVKYSHPGTTVRIYLRQSGNRALITVENDGETIPEEDLPRLFDRFYRVDKARSSVTGGSGLGLAIAKSIVEMHGGAIWAESKNGQNRFILSLPLI